jgi:hypothetical protein
MRTQNRLTREGANVTIAKQLEPENRTPIGAFDQDPDLEGAGPSAPRWTIGALFWSQQGHEPNVGSSLVPRLQGTAALQSQCRFQGGMASAFAKASSFVKASEDKSADTSVPSQF